MTTYPQLVPGSSIADAAKTAPELGELPYGCHECWWSLTSRTLDLEKRLLGQWNALIRRARIGREFKAAAFTMSSYADPDGTGIWLSVARYAVDLDVSYSTARRYLAWLRKVGLLEMTRPGNRRKGTASEYQLTLGPDVLETLNVLSPTEHKARTEEVREAERDGSRGRAARAKDSDQRSPQASVDDDPETDQSYGDQRSPERALAEPINAQMGVDQRSPWMTYTPFSTHLSVIERPSRADDEDLRTDLALVGAPESEAPTVVVEIFPGASQEPPFVTAPLGRKPSRAQQAIAEASARRAAAVAAHRAKEAQ